LGRKRFPAIEVEMPDSVRFIILCAARTGSTMLRHMITSHPDACCHGEVLGRPMGGFDGLDFSDPRQPIVAKLRALREDDPLSFMRDFVLFRGELSAVGFKIKYDELVQPEYAAILAALRDDLGLRVVHLKRHNRLKRFVSHVAALRSGVNNLQVGAGTPPVERFPLSLEDCLEDFRLIRGREERFSTIFEGHPTIDIIYEEVASADPASLVDVQQFLGLSPQPLEARTVKMNPDCLADILTNYDELRERMATTPNAIFLDPANPAN
jgi:LPS sulfotransferase NodH